MIRRQLLLLALASLPGQSYGGDLADSSAPEAAPQAKRTAPPEVKPVNIGRLRIEVIPWGRSRGLEQNGGYIAAIDRTTGRELWTLKVYDIAYDPSVERDVQDIFIVQMTKLPHGRVSIVDEEDRRYVVDIRRRTVKRQ